MNTDDINFAYKVRHALNARLDEMPASTADRLANARKMAVSRKKAHAPAKLAQRSLAGNIGAFFSFSSLGRAGVAIPLMALVAGLAGIYQYEQERRIEEIAELDAAVLSDELPLTAYLDHGFNAYLAQRVQ
ncbi:DUF3619 family protein [Massilia psychrophila]|jgi:hypothetical protein|uniref:DUF3619 domain-containing protein n=1 Tax=Massilia psychrophila TaxID=1603353 RepID=A0A2G8SXA4_9BURK|nr:DUF3619 family protein [Massilia psychrophila]PIL38394.1 hypothetical protein CR103_18210 [Massilia psychrophila]GGE81744.1 hypothetical protein GCM10008020_28300 [Massilia psychrophila]